MIRRSGSGRLSSQANNGREDINPMSGVANLADAMLVLAVGIMLALIVSWNLNVTEGKVNANVSKDDAASSFTEDDVKDNSTSSDNLEAKGTVYYDPETDKFYIIANDGAMTGDK